MWSMVLVAWCCGYSLFCRVWCGHKYRMTVGENLFRLDNNTFWQYFTGVDHLEAECAWAQSYPCPLFNKKWHTAVVIKRTADKRLWPVTLNKEVHWIVLRVKRAANVKCHMHSLWLWCGEHCSCSSLCKYTELWQFLHLRTPKLPACLCDEFRSWCVNSEDCEEGWRMKKS